MQEAIHWALRARELGQRPFGTVIMDRTGGFLAAAAGSETPIRPTRHSEVLAIEAACRELGGLLYGCTMYQTHEPCHMCAGAIKHAKIERVVWGTGRNDLPELFRPYTTSTRALLQDTTAPVSVTEGVCWSECLALFDQELALRKRQAQLLEGRFIREGGTIWDSWSRQPGPIYEGTEAEALVHLQQLSAQALDQLGTDPFPTRPKSLSYGHGERPPQSGRPGSRAE